MRQFTRASLRESWFKRMEIVKLDQNRIRKGLRDRVSVVVFDGIDSTNSEGKRRLLNGLSVPTLLLSEEQTDGRGRAGHHFFSPKYHGIYMTLLYPADMGKENLLRITAKTAVAVVRGLRQKKDEEYRIKWVNDIYIGSQKVAGILTEYLAEKNALIIGIGINVTTGIFPEDLIGRARSLNPLGDGENYFKNAYPPGGTPPDRNELAISVTDALLYELEHPDDREYLKEYRELSNVIGRQIEYGEYDPSGLTRSVKGKALAIEEDGALLVEREDGRTERLDSGEIRVRTVEGDKI